MLYLLFKFILEIFGGTMLFATILLALVVVFFGICDAFKEHRGKDLSFSRFWLLAAMASYALHFTGYINLPFPLIWEWNEIMWKAVFYLALLSFASACMIFLAAYFSASLIFKSKARSRNNLYLVPFAIFIFGGLGVCLMPPVFPHYIAGLVKVQNYLNILIYTIF